MLLSPSSKEALESSYELCFNAACALIDEGRLKEAEAGNLAQRAAARQCYPGVREEKLARAKELCTEELMQACAPRAGRVRSHKRKDPTSWLLGPLRAGFLILELLVSRSLMLV